MKIYILLIPILFAFSCKDVPKKEYYVKNSVLFDSKTHKPYNGIVKGTSDDKVVEYQVKDGIKDGPFTMSLKNGKVIMKGQIVSGKNVGKWEYFYYTGELESQGSFINDIPEGIWTWYFPDGKTREIGKYIKGSRDSVWVNYDQNGQLIMKKNFDMGKEIIQ